MNDEIHFVQIFKFFLQIVTFYNITVVGNSFVFLSKLIDKSPKRQLHKYKLVQRYRFNFFLIKVAETPNKGIKL